MLHCCGCAGWVVRSLLTDLPSLNGLLAMVSKKGGEATSGIPWLSSVLAGPARPGLARLQLFNNPGLIINSRAAT